MARQGTYKEDHTMTTPLRSAFRFMLAHGGYIVGEHAKSALDLARAELLLGRAIDAGAASVEWVDDQEPYDPGDVCTQEEARKRFDSNEWTGPFGCIVSVGEEFTYNTTSGAETQRETTASLWGIVVSHRGTNDPYCRVVAAELALEVEDDLRQALGDALDARLCTI
jgi:hypothetical protein